MILIFANLVQKSIQFPSSNIRYQSFKSWKLNYFTSNSYLFKPNFVNKDSINVLRTISFQFPPTRFASSECDRQCTPSWGAATLGDSRLCSPAGDSILYFMSVLSLSYDTFYLELHDENMEQHPVQCQVFQSSPKPRFMWVQSGLLLAQHLLYIYKFIIKEDVYSFRVCIIRND